LGDFGGTSVDKTSKGFEETVVARLVVVVDASQPRGEPRGEDLGCWEEEEVELERVLSEPLRERFSLVEEEPEVEEEEEEEVEEEEE
jgi:hypothetical protein